MVIYPHLHDTIQFAGVSCFYQVCQLLIDHLSDTIVLQICIEHFPEESHWLTVDISDLYSCR